MSIGQAGSKATCMHPARECGWLQSPGVRLRGRLRDPSTMTMQYIKIWSGDVVECHGPPSKSDTIVVFARSSADLHNGGAPPFAILSSVVAIVDGVSP